MFTLTADREMRELLGPNSSVIRPIPAEGFLKSNVFKRWHADAVECVEHLRQRFGLRLDKVLWKVTPSYAVLLRLVSPAQKYYFVTSTGPILRLYQERVDEKHLLKEYRHV